MAIIAPNIGIDLGTSNTRLFVAGRGLVIDEPSIVSVPLNDNRAVKAVGSEARTLLGRTAGDITTIRPMANGMIRDDDMTRAMLSYFIKKAIGTSRLAKPRAVITVPCRVSPIEKRAIRQAACDSGLKPSFIRLIEKPIASAIGSNIAIYEPCGNMIVDIGGGTTEIAVISAGGIVISRSLRVGGEKMDEAIISYVKKEFNILIGDRTAESVKMDLGAALRLKEERKVTIRGRDLITSLPQTATLSSNQVYEALSLPCRSILEAIRKVLENTPPELAGDIVRTGIHLTGGGSLLFGLDQLISQELELPVLMASDPMSTAALGVGHLAENMEFIGKLITGDYQEDSSEETKR